MTSPPDADPESGPEPPVRLMTPFIWVLLVFSALCIGAGAALALLGPRLLAPAEEASQPASERLAGGPVSAK